MMRDEAARLFDAGRHPAGIDGEAAVIAICGLPPLGRHGPARWSLLPAGGAGVDGSAATDCRRRGRHRLRRTCTSTLPLT
jgi:hypothetical protein